MKLNKVQKKELLIDMIKELANMQADAPSEYVINKMRPILLGFLKETLDIKKGLIYININMKESKSVQNKVFWIKVSEVIKKYFESIQ